MALFVGGIAGTINIILNRGEIYFDSLTVLVFLLLVGRWMQYKQQRRADASVELLFSLTPSTCHIVQDGNVTDVPIEALNPGDVVEVRSGELIPADGVVTAGRSAVNQALLTGESIPAEVQRGHTVHAGAQNIGSILRLRVEKTGQATRVGQLMRLVERGVSEKPAIVQFADRVGAWFILAVLISAAATFAFWCRIGLSQAIDHTVALLIVTCPCVLGLATPLTLAMTIGRLARTNILVKSGAALERLARGGRVILDKTGTLTEGRLRLVTWAGDSSICEKVVAIERFSNHPIARALVAELGDSKSELAPTNISERHDGGISATLEGQRICIGSPGFIARHAQIPSDLEAQRERFESEGATVICISIDGRGVALAALADRLRGDSGDAVKALTGMGWEPSILSGDGDAVVHHIAGQIDIDSDHSKGDVSPEEKLAQVQRLQGGNRAITVMVGDGVNDAAALAAADVGIAVHGGAEASLAAADVYVARPGLMPLAELFATSRHAMHVIRRNLLVSLGYNILAGTLAAAGVMTPLLAAIIMPVSSATVLFLAMASIMSWRPLRGGTWK
jgi:Cu2+-exporting ATPase